MAKLSVILADRVSGIKQRKEEKKMIAWILIIIVAILFLFVDITLGVIVGFVGVAFFILDKVFGWSLDKVIARDVKREMKKEGFSDEEIKKTEKGIKIAQGKTAEGLDILKEFVEKKKKEQKSE